MNGVEIIVLVTLIIILSLTLTVRSQSSVGSQPKKGPGISACNIYGYYDGACSGTPVLPTDIIPQECTSLFWDGITIDISYNVEYSYMDGDDYGVLDQLLQTGKSVYVYYGSYTQQEWTQVFGCSLCDGAINAYDSMKGLGAYMNAHPGIAGLVLTQLTPNEYSLNFPGYTESLIAYIKVMRETFPSLEIGMELIGSFLIDYDVAPTVPWLNFEVLNQYMDFYVISLCGFNNCTSQFTVGGTVPVSGDAVYTLTKVQNNLLVNGIPSEKTYYSFRLAATSEDLDTPSCNRTYQEICTKPSATSSYCADTTQSFFEKGQFVKQNAAGFVGTSIDFADPYCQCGCGRPFAPFYDILDGFNGNTAPASCSSMDRLLC